MTTENWQPEQNLKQIDKLFKLHFLHKVLSISLKLKSLLSTVLWSSTTILSGEDQTSSIYFPSSHVLVEYTNAMIH